MRSRNLPGLTSGREDGAVLIYVVLAISLMVVGLTALAVDSGHMVMVRNELQNSADAASLAGAGVLFNPEDGSVNTGALTEADALARENPATGADRASGSTAHDKLDVEVQIGHWSFAGTYNGVTVADEFYPASSPYNQLDGWQALSADELNTFDGQGGRPMYINAVQVTTVREHTRGIFTNIFGWKDSDIATDAVAYIGFAASVDAGTVDIPFAICREYITDENGALYCGVARSQNEGIETGGWTNFTQDRGEETCESSSATDLKDDILGGIPPCEDLNVNPLDFGEEIGAIQGAVASAFKPVLEYCFVDAAHNLDDPGTYFQNATKYNATKPWMDVTLPVVLCYEGNYEGGACEEDHNVFDGVVTVDIIWMSFGKDNVPVEYHHDVHGDGTVTNWFCSDPTNNALCWQEFQQAYGWNFYDDGDGLPDIETIYFAPTCEDTQSVGGVGADNSGIHAAIPVLVE